MPRARAAARTASQASMCWSGSSPATITTGGSFFASASASLSAKTFKRAPSQGAQAVEELADGDVEELAAGLLTQVLLVQQVGVAHRRSEERRVGRRRGARWSACAV